jgi:hypothetical protein
MRIHFALKVGRENVMPNIQAALNRAREIHAAQTALAS